MASNASHSTITKIATPAPNAPGAGIICGIVLVCRGSSECPKETLVLGDQPGADADFRLEQLRDRTARLRVFHRCIELCFVRSRNLSNKVQVALCDCKSIRQFLQRNRCGGLQLACGHPRIPQLRGKRHSKASRVSRRQKFLRICPDAVFKPRTEGILRLLEHAAIRRNRALAVSQPALPHCRTFTLHVSSPLVLFVL